ncbi:MAG TPA: class I SAM-dependent methyltransferase [Methanocella sp.]|uniref:class I SAM-dependent methyltransferase n=1 Tax=Methanocella sp. TaxID=2052833 RepID=UPI002D0B5500|nr:class I SAM-dependent methyltransferase [Methanocella sp.]HTY92222.1 class I SAM-dependent methyltransferase [Methanocella sp.]
MHGYKRWDESDRRKTMDPDVILSKAGLKPGMTIVDIGCGQGYFAVPAARIVGPKGRVYGIDVDADALELVDRKASDAGLNIKTIAAEAESAVACEGCADIAFFGICLHDFQDPQKVLANARKMLRLGGRLADLDWKKEPMEGGPPLEIRLSEQKASRLIADARFKVESVEDISGRYYLILAKI